MQYAKAFTDALQFMWGKGFLSPGGPEEVRQMLAGQDLTGKIVLDVGAGLGGIDVLLAREHGAAEVVGIDVEPQLIEAARALAREADLEDRLRFDLVEPGPLPYADASFDAVFSKDAMVHIPDKAAFYREVLRVLRPGGRFIAADWLWKEGAGTSPPVVTWLSKGPLKFAFTTPAEAETALRDAGFADVALIDCRAALQASNREEIRVLEGPAMAEMAKVVGEEMARSRLASARGRQGALDSGDLIPCHIVARKPLAA
ncbi:MAG: methyltransferase domain-containing protein [Alphaproteobacteria bacterium]|nr:methyltransferase domain-containing protein [Alphaproteobacteria bacterium]